MFYTNIPVILISSLFEPIYRLKAALFLVLDEELTGGVVNVH